MFNGEPNIVLALESSSNILENPKSATFILPLCFSKLASLKSLCIILCFVRVLKALKTCRRNSTASCSVIFFLYYKYSIMSPYIYITYLHYSIQALSKNYLKFSLNRKVL